MAKTKVVQISKDCEINLCSFDGGQKYLSIDYLERSPAHGYSDTETSVDIDSKTAREIISLLQEYIADPCEGCVSNCQGAAVCNRLKA